MDRNECLSVGRMKAIVSCVLDQDPAFAIQEYLGEFAHIMVCLPCLRRYESHISVADQHAVFFGKRNDRRDPQVFDPKTGEYYFQ